jgi:hypothetical protein
VEENLRLSVHHPYILSWLSLHCFTFSSFVLVWYCPILFYSTLLHCCRKYSTWFKLFNFVHRAFSWLYLTSSHLQSLIFLTVPSSPFPPRTCSLLSSPTSVESPCRRHCSIAWSLDAAQGTGKPISQSGTLCVCVCLAAVCRQLCFSVTHMISTSWVLWSDCVRVCGCCSHRL